MYTSRGLSVPSSGPTEVRSTTIKVTQSCFNLGAPLTIKPTSINDDTRVPADMWSESIILLSTNHPLQIIVRAYTGDNLGTYV
ncbi:uncharacterized protein N7511_004357 [Penicillium nucicola]|uniref:uncharacterized protein n=1 Tax=Penicillium nucicola TaxID=1850975 RepID=UPI002544FB6F|nr:uncharacterized protein N7511_004357 [Penicillium nucicola]KAJ5766741.1 hypothetical protein N7511_004357 [Penicillium nucicola]